MKKFSKLSLRIQILSMVLLLVIIIPILILLFYNQAKDVILKQNIKHNTEIASILQQDISNRYSEISNLLVYTGYHGSIIDFMNAGSNIETFKASRNIADLFQLVYNTQSGINDIIVTNNEGRVYSTFGHNISNIPKCLEANDGQIYYDGLAKINTIFNSTTDVFSFSMNVFSDGTVAPLGEKIGNIRLLLEPDFIKNVISKLPNLSNTNTFLILKDNTVFTSNNPSNLNLSKEEFQSIKNISETPTIYYIDGSKYLLQVHSIPEIEGSIITATIYDDLIGGLDRVRMISILFFLILLIVVAIPYAIIVHNFITPLNKLMEFMVSLNGGNLKVLKETVNLEGYPEIEVISDEFNRMLRQINSLNQQLFTTTTTLFQQEIESQKLQNANLQSQINPHFLFNTLDSIKGISLASGNREIYKIASSFSAIFSYSTKNCEFAILKEELKVADHFLSIIAIRFSDRIRYEIMSCDKLNAQKVPKMILQPIIEQAITYSLEPLIEGGHLIIQVNEKNTQQYEIHILDNGIGIDKQDVENLNIELGKDDVMNQNEDVRFKNLHSINLRIKMAFGKEYGLSIKSQKDQGIETILLLPINDIKDQLVTSSLSL